MEAQLQTKSSPLLNASAAVQGPCFQPQEAEMLPSGSWEDANYSLPELVLNDDGLEQGIERLIHGWNDDKIASVLGPLEDDQYRMDLEAAHEDEEQMLAEMMENAGKP